jgi:hypothetical protein
MIFFKFRSFYSVCLLSGLLLLCGCAGAVAQEPLIPGAKTVLPIFQNSVKQLQGQTQIPIVLPTEIPHSAIIYAHLDSSDSSSYLISLNNTADCQGETYCSFGNVYAQRVYQDTPSIQSELADSSDSHPTSKSPETAGEVQLAHGITGFFSPYACYAYCTTSDLLWEQNGVRYSVSLRLGSKAALVAMANSAIENEQ